MNWLDRLLGLAPLPVLIPLLSFVGAMFGVIVMAILLTWFQWQPGDY